MGIERPIGSPFQSVAGGMLRQDRDVDPDLVAGLDVV